jgi:hypothetical protein
VNITNTTAPVVAGTPLSVNATVENTGDVSDTQTVQVDAGALGTDATTVSLAGEASTTVTLTLSTADDDYGTYTVTVESANNDATTSARVTLPTLGQNPPRDPGDDGQYEDIDGDGRVNIFDVQALFNRLGDSSVQDHPQAFSFSPASPSTEVTILDVATHWRAYLKN